MFSLMFGYHIITGGKALKENPWITRQIPDIFQGPLTKIFGWAVALPSMPYDR